MMSEPLSVDELQLVARLYGLDPDGMSREHLINEVEYAGGCGAWEVCRAVLDGMDYPVDMPKDLPTGPAKWKAIALVRALPLVLSHYTLAEVAAKLERLDVMS